MMLQLLLANTIDEAAAMLLYKLVVLRFLSTFLRESFVKQLDTNTAMQMIAKIVRHLYKEDIVLQHNLSGPEYLTLLAKQSQVAVADAVERAHDLLDKRWAAIIKTESEESKLEPPPLHEQFLADTKHDVTNIENHIECLNTVSDIQIHLEEYQPKSTESFYHHKFLNETETQRRDDLLIQNSENIRKRFDKYLRKALKFYFSDDEARVVNTLESDLRTRQDIH